ncbi:hypothetical protein HK405_008577 [Cladochytrium tenue]|nr:hypothetical protein HK405_008577 [Cladochytrium tenue]
MPATTTGSTAASQPNGLDTVAAPPPRRAAVSRRDEGIARMGTYMLQGWVMMDQTCRNAGCGLPVFRPRGPASSPPARPVCCLCDDPHDPRPPAQPAAQSSSTLPPVSTLAVDDSFGAPQGPDPADAHADDLDDDHDHDASMLSRPPTATTSSAVGTNASALLGQRLMLGWTMLAESCPRCVVVPLMRRGEVTECVVCSWSPTAAPLALNVSPPAAATVGNAEMAPASAPSPAALDPKLTPTVAIKPPRLSAEAPDRHTGGLPPASTAPVRDLAAAISTASAAANSVSSELPPETRTAALRVVGALTSRLDALAAAVAACGTESPVRLRELADATAACATAIRETAVLFGAGK